MQSDKWFHPTLTILSILLIVVLAIIFFQGILSFNNATPNASSENKTLTFSGYQWWIKTSDTPVGPGPNYFSDSKENVWIDDQAHLHLKTTQRDGRWYSAEVVCNESFGYGEYSFSVFDGIDQLNDNVVLGLFTWNDALDYHHREIDIELSRWGNATNENAQYVVQPYQNPDNIHRFNLDVKHRNTIHRFNWTKDKITFMSEYSSIPSSDSFPTLIHSWEYAGDDIPVPGKENVRINLWLFEPSLPDNKENEVVIEYFKYNPSQ